VPEWQVILLRPARRYLERLSEADQRRILDALEELRIDPMSAPVKPLRGRPEWSLRIGGWRALLRVDREARLIVVTRLGPRGDVYKG
jgi:mRNA interferase RelE/StbE